MSTIMRTVIDKAMRASTVVSTVSCIDGFETTHWEFDGIDRQPTAIEFDGKDFDIESAAERHSKVVVRAWRED